MIVLISFNEILFLILGISFSLQLNVVRGQDDFFYNPIVPYYSADPFMTRVGDSYYFVLTNVSTMDLTLMKSDKITDWTNAEKTVVYQARGNEAMIWAPEVHYFGGGWHIYFAMVNGEGSPPGHRTYVISAVNSSDPMGSWGLPVRMKLDEKTDAWAIDATVLHYCDGRDYLVWSAWPREAPPYITNGSIYIAELENPYKIIGDRVLIREPKADWESFKEGEFTVRLNEAPEILINGNRTFIVLSANGAPKYCLAIMGIDDCRDPLNPASWWNDYSGPVFYENDQQSVYTTGHCSFTVSPDGNENWIIYHAVDSNEYPPDVLQTMRTARAEKFTWNIDGTPKFPRPTGVNVPILIPSGQAKH